MNGPRSFQVNKAGDVTIFVLPDNLFETMAIVSVNDELLEQVEAERPKKVVVDFQFVQFCGSQAVGGLVRLSHRIRGYQGEICVCGMNERIKEIFRVCRLVPAVFHHYDNEQAAIDALGGSTGG